MKNIEIGIEKFDSIVSKIYLELLISKKQFLINLDEILVDIDIENWKNLGDDDILFINLKRLKGIIISNLNKKGYYLNFVK